MNNKPLIIILSVIVIALSALSIYLYFDKDKLYEKNEETEKYVPVEGTAALYFLSQNYPPDSKLLKTYDNAKEIKEFLNKAELSMSIIDYATGPDYKLSLSASEHLYFRIGSIIRFENIDGTQYVLTEEDSTKLMEFLDLPSVSNECHFTYTYNILNMEDSNDERSVYLTLKEFQGEDVVTVRLDKNLTDFKVGNNYEFNFILNHKINLYNISEYFDFAELESVEFTNKVGLEQNNTDTCNFL